MRSLRVTACLLTLLAGLNAGNLHAVALAFTLKDRVGASEIVAEVEVESCKTYQDSRSPEAEAWEAELTCKPLKVFKGPKDLQSFALRVHVFNKQTTFTGKKLLVFAFRFEDPSRKINELRAFDGLNGLINIGGDFWDLSQTPDSHGSYMRPLSYEETLKAVEKAVQDERSSHP